METMEEQLETNIQNTTQAKTECSIGDSESRDNFSCPECDEFFTDTKELHSHQMDIHGISESLKSAPKLTKCPYCSYTSGFPGNIKRHIHTSHQDKPRCRFCADDMDDEEELKQHVLEKHADAKIQCKTCEKQCRSLPGLLFHISSCHGEETSEQKPIKCSGCYYTTKTKEKLVKHMKAVSCNKCEREVTFVCMNELKSHVKKIHGKDPDVRKVTICQCGKEYKSKNGYYAHRKLVHPESVKNSKRVGKKSNICHICGKEFPIWEYLKTHLRYHEDSKRFECPNCHRQFKYRSGFKNHTEGCLNQSGFPCEVCGKTYKNDYTLKLHIRHKHIGDTFACRLCGTKFTYRDQRNQHEKVCVGPRNQHEKVCDGTMAEIQQPPDDIAARQKQITVDYRSKFHKNMAISFAEETDTIHHLKPEQPVGESGAQYMPVNEELQDLIKSEVQTAVAITQIHHQY